MARGTSEHKAHTCLGTQLLEIAKAEASKLTKRDAGYYKCVKCLKYLKFFNSPKCPHLNKTSPSTDHSILRKADGTDGDYPVDPGAAQK